MDFALKRRLRVATPKRSNSYSRRSWRSYARTYAAALGVVTTLVVLAITTQTAVSVYGWFKHADKECSKRTWLSKDVCAYIDEPIKNGPLVALLFFTSAELSQPKIILNILLASLVLATVVEATRAVVTSRRLDG